MHRIPNLAALAASSALARPAAVAGMVKADASDPKALVAQLAAAFEEFKATHAQQVAAKVDDTLFNTKLGVLNDTMSNLEAALDEQAKLIAAARMGTGAPGDMEATDPEYLQLAAAFEEVQQARPGAWPQLPNPGDWRSARATARCIIFTGGGRAASGEVGPIPDKAARPPL